MSNTLAKAVDLARLGVIGFDAIAKITRNTTDDKIAEAFSIIRKIVDSVDSGAAGRISLEASELAVAQVTDREKANDDVIDAARRARWHDDERTDD